MKNFNIRKFIIPFLIVIILMSSCAAPKVDKSNSDDGFNSLNSVGISDNSFDESLYENISEEEDMQSDATINSNIDESASFDVNSENSEDSSKNESSKEESKAISKDESKTTSKEESIAISKDESKTTSKDESKSTSKDESKADTSRPTVSEDSSTPPPTKIKARKVAYIPLDDRPVNVDRVIYQAQSGDIELLMPDNDLYATKLDGRGTNSNGTKYGDRAALVNWLKSVEDECDVFLISLDQILSGGLVGSRSMNSENLSFEYAVIDYIAELAKENKVYLFDTVMRLASTVEFDGYTINEYTKLRNYGSIPRKQISGKNLTVQNIVSGYEIGENGSKINTSLSGSIINNYLRSRSRKLRLIDYILEKTEKNDNVYCYIGIDDSSPKITIQTNEINYIKSKLGKRGALFAGTDELGMMGLAKFCVEYNDTALKVAVRYYGGLENEAADAFDIGTLAENVNSHLLSLDAKIISSGNADLEVLVLTKPNCDAAHKKNIAALIERTKQNFKTGTPTAIIDASGRIRALQESMVQNLELMKLVGYSNWNTVGNAVGIALGQSFTRTTHLKYSDKITVNSHNGFLKSMTFAYIKDISYIIDMSRQYDFIDLPYYLSNSDEVNSNLKSKIMNNTRILSATSILGNINKSSYIIDFAPYKENKVKVVSVDKFRLPWYRSFEMTFEIECS